MGADGGREGGGHERGEEEEFTNKIIKSTLTLFTAVNV